MAASQMYSSTPTPINTTVKSMASTGQNINVFFNSEKDTKYKKIEGYKDPEKYLGKVIVNPESVGREYIITFEKETITKPYMWFNDRIVEIEPLVKPSVSKSSFNKPNVGASMGSSNKVSMVQNPSMSTALEASLPSAVKENNWVNVKNSNENVANENNWVQVKKRNTQNKGTFGGKSRKKGSKRQIKSKKIKRLSKRTSRRY